MFGPAAQFGSKKTMAIVSLCRRESAVFTHCPCAELSGADKISNDKKPCAQEANLHMKTKIKKP